MVFYTVPGKNDKKHGCMVQFYKMDGHFVEEVEFPGNVPYTMWFEKMKNLLYSISFETDEELDESHYILEYKIHENAN